MLREGIALIGAESSWPHGIGTRPASEPSSDALPSCKSLAWATNVTAAAMLRSNSTYSGQSRTLPSITSSSNISTVLGSRRRLQGCHSVTPTSWQVGPQLHMLANASGHCLCFLLQSSCAPAYTLRYTQYDVGIRHLHAAGCQSNWCCGCRSWSP